jgi:DNA-binding response OmpR family regulator
MRTLIVEDEWMIAALIEQTLAEAGIEVLGKPGSIGKALRLIEEMSCDAAVLDADLDGVSAEPVADALHERGIPFLVVSGYASEQRSGRLAAAPFLRKPFAPQQLVELIRTLAV